MQRRDKFLKMLIEVMKYNFEHSEIICVNDSSTDNSLTVIKETSGIVSTTSVSVVKMSCFYGFELAMNAGVDLSIGDYVVEFDNTNPDFDSSVIVEVYRYSLKRYDIVSASPERKIQLKILLQRSCSLFGCELHNAHRKFPGSEQESD